jgi:23S rRNA (uracil1939-C5)-methyltransferase
MARRKQRKLPEATEPATIHALSHEGRGIANVNGKTTFIRGALPDESVQYHYTQCRGKFDEAAVDEVLTASPDRVRPKCEVFGRCGGCSLQHLHHDKQLIHKQQVLAEHFAHFGQVSPKTWLKPLTAAQWGYRRKARLGVRHVPKKGGVLVGFREQDGRFLTDMSRCEVLHPSVGESIQLLRDWLGTLAARDQIPQLEVAVDDQHTAMIIRHLQPLSDHDLCVIKAFAQQQNWWVYLQSKGPDTITLFWPEQDNAQLSYQLAKHQITVQFYPQDFTQVNHELNHQMVDQALALLDLQPSDRVLDLFCGLGNFSLPIARYAKAVVGVEGDPAMAVRALKNAQHNQIENAQFYAANLFEALADLPFSHQAFDKVLLDPPRAGAEMVMHWVAQQHIARVVYVSCNPATLARDIGILVNEYGYQLEQAGIMDMFAHTSHVESIALLTCRT